MKRKNCVPTCPHCGTECHKTRNTYYTSHDEILRSRKCEECGHKWWTYQEPEFALDMGQYKVKIANWNTPEGSKKRIELVKL